MSHQQIRAELETITQRALIRAGVLSEHIFYNNVQETPAAPTETYASINLSFTGIAIQTLGCNLRQLKGTLAVNVYTPKAQGSSKGELVCSEVALDWLELNCALKISPNGLRTQNFEGPTTIAPDARPHHCNNVACSFTAAAG